MTIQYGDELIRQMWPNRSQSKSMPPNLCRRPARPSAGRGRIQRGVRRGFVMMGRSEMSTTEGLRYTHVLWPHQGRKIHTNTYRRVRSRLDEIADRIGRSRSRGRPWIWRLRKS
jgi:hypothetical protein